MSQGGTYAWKRRHIVRKSAAPPDYRRLLRPLPDPPAGMSWIRNAADAGNPWMLVVVGGVGTTATTECGVVATAVPERDAAASALDSTATAAAEATVVVPVAATTGTTRRMADATTAVLAVTDGSNCNRSDDGSLPQAQMITGVNDDGDDGSKLACAAATSAVDAADGADTADKDEIWNVEDYTRHVILPHDTLAGLCLRYKIDRRTLQRANRFYGDDLRLAPDILHVPISAKARRLGWKRQDPDSREVKMAAVLAAHPSLSLMEANWYVRFGFLWLENSMGLLIG